MTELKLFVWNHFAPDLREDGLAFAIAENETDAKKQILEKMGVDWEPEWNDVEIKPISEKVGYGVSGGG